MILDATLIARPVPRTTTAAGQLRPIQYLRALAALMVVWQHATQALPNITEFIPATQVGEYAVHLFFVISGFIMLIATWDKRMTPVQFIKHRIVRIVPLYWSATLLLVVLAALFAPWFRLASFDALSIVKSLLFIPYASLDHPNAVFPILVPGWTLNYEMFFYTLFALSLWLPQARRVQVMVVVLCALMSIGWVLHVTNPVAVACTSPRLAEFGLGMLLGLLWLSRPVVWDWNNRILLLLGNASYSIYLSHIFTLGVVRVIWRRTIATPSLPSSVAFMLLSLVVSAVVGCLCYQYIERPQCRVLRRVWTSS